MFLFSVRAILLSMFLTVSTPVLAKTAWIGMAGSGSGLGLLGHAFLVIQDDGVDILDARAFSYRVELSDPTGIGEIFDLTLAQTSLREPVRFTIEQKRLGEFILEYTGRQERELRIFALNLSIAEINALEVRLSRDVLAPSPADLRFSLMSNNCVTRPLEHINAVVTPERQVYISSFWDPYAPTLSFLRNPGAAMLVKVPLYLPALMANHPISAKRQLDFGRDVRLRATVFLRTLRPALERLAICERWSREFLQAVESTMLLVVHAPSPAGLAGIEELEAIAPCSREPSVWNDLLEGVSEMIPRNRLRRSRRDFKEMRDRILERREERR